MAIITLGILGLAWIIGGLATGNIVVTRGEEMEEGTTTEEMKEEEAA